MKKIVIVVIMICLVIFGVRLYDNRLGKDSVIDKIVSKIDDKTDRDFLLWIENKYGSNIIVEISKYLDDNSYSKDLWHQFTGLSYIVLMDMYNNEYDTMDNIKIIEGENDGVISFVGDVSLADNWYIMPKYDLRGKGIYGILSKEVVDIMTSSEIMIPNSEFTVSNRGEKMPGKMYTFRARPDRLAIYDEMGVDLVTLANNHVYDFGEDAFNDMLDSFKKYKIPYIGAGKNIDEAKRPYYYILNGYKIGFVNATRAEKTILTPEATDDTGGVFRCYDPSGLVDLIKDVKSKSDYVITLVHWGREDSHELEDVQKTTGKLYIDSGSDAIIGTHAHYLQGIEFYKDKPIVYNLGDFIFNNETKDTGIFQIKLNNNGKMDYYFIPAIEKDEYTELLSGNERMRVINDMNRWSINAKIDNDGKIKST